MGERRVSVPLWMGYTAAFLTAWFFSAGCCVHFPLMGSLPDLVPVCIAFAAVLEGSFAGSVFGLCLGLFSCLAQGGSGAGMIFFGAVIGMLAGLWQQHRLRRHWYACLSSAFLALVGVNALRILLRLVFTGGGSLAVMCRIAAFEVVYSMLLALPVYPLFRFIHRRLGTS